MDSHLPVITRITRIDDHTPSVKTFHFDTKFPFVPGQFVMVWVPSVDEVPMALSSASSITVQKVGDATAAMFRWTCGDRIGIRGPFGNGFSVAGRTLIVAGGIGAAPMLPLVQEHAIDCVLLGARTAGDLLFTREFEGAGTFLVATDDGTAGRAGFVVELMEEVDLPAFDAICVCGPERMMYSVLVRLAQDNLVHSGQFSLHRYMKCGIGVCGSCCIDPGGLRVCRDGPVFRGDILLNSEFGKYSRDASGKRVFLP